MNRRLFLANGVVTVIGLSGCLGRSVANGEGAKQLTSTPVPAPTAPENEAARTMPHIIRRDFTLLDHYPEKEFKRTKDRIRNAVHVTFDSEDNRVVVIGLIESGQRSCMRTFLQKATYIPKRDILDIVVADKTIDSDGPCSSEIAVVPYELVIAFENGLPETVILEYDSDLQKSDFTETVTDTTSNQSTKK